MAALILRTINLLVFLLILVNSASETKCESDAARPAKQSMPMPFDEHLLRSGEERPEKSTEEDLRTTKPKEAKSSEGSDQKAFDTTTDSPQATTEYQESIEEEEYEDRKSEDLTTLSDVTTTGVEEIQQITDRMDVYTKQKDVVGDSVATDKENTPAKTEPTITSSSQMTTEALEVAPRTLLDDPDEEVFRQRSPKTDNSDQKPQIDKRNFDYPKPAADQPEASKSSTLRDWIQDSWLRSPSAILVPLRPGALSRALAVWNDLNSVGGLNVSDIIIVGYDSNGVNWRSRHNLLGSHAEGGTRAVSEALSKLLFKYKDVNTNELAGDATMRALASAAKLVPYDSALFVMTDKAPADAQRLPLALRALVEKRLKVYTIWTDPKYPSTESDAALQELRNISAHTEGDILPYSLQVMEMDNIDNLTAEKDWAPLETPQPRTAKLSAFVEDKLETLLVKRGGGGAISLGVPVETGVTGLRLYIEGAVEHAVLYPPNEAPQIDLYNQTSVESFFEGSRTDSLSPRDVYLVFPGARSGNDMLAVLPMSATKREDTPAPTAGVWHLSLRCDTCDYRLTICAYARVRFDTTQLPNDMLSIRVLGPVATVRESTLVDEYGTELSKLAFSYQPAAGEDDPRIGDGDQELVAEIPLPGFKEPKVYVKIVGRDLHGESFARLSGPLNKGAAEVRMGRSASIVFPEADDLATAEAFSLRQYDARGRYNDRQYDARGWYNDSDTLPNNRATSQVVNTRGTLMTTVQIGLSSRLYGAPGDTLQLHFEVTNYREQAVNFRFEAVGELRFLRGISPASQTIASGQTANVVVTIGITASAQPGARDLITFTAYGLETVSISSYVYVVNADSIVSDTWAPSVRHTFQGHCIGRTGDDCAQHVWGASVFARDAVSGLLRLSSTPIGLLYEGNFISGTREEVAAGYRATCCAPRLLLTAVDARGNANSYVIDISNYFTPASVAAIVLGVFLFIALIAILVLLIYWCVRRRKESRDMPSYATSSRRDIS